MPTVMHAQIVNGEHAVDLIGQYGDNIATPLPVYTKSAANNVANRYGLNAPTGGVTLDDVNHRLFVSDTSNHRVLIYNLDSNDDLIDRLPDNVLGQPNFYSNTAANSQNVLNGPTALAHDKINNILYVASLGNRVMVFDVASITDGENAVNIIGQVSFAGATAGSTQAGLNVPQGLAYDPVKGRLFVAQSTGNRVTVYNLTGGLAFGPNAVDAIGQFDDNLSAPEPIYTKSTVNNGPNRHGLSAPLTGIALDQVNHRLFLSDTSNNRVLVYNLDSNNQLIDRLPDNVLGQLNFYSNTAANTQNGLNLPEGLAYDSVQNRLFVVTSNRVFVFDAASITDGENAVNVLGQQNFTTVTAGTTQAGMNVPRGIAYDSANNRLFVAQNTANRVTVYDVATISNGENAINVVGQINFTNTAAATTQAGMNVPFDVVYDQAGQRLFVSQGTGNRVTVYNVASITDGEDAINVLGQTNFTNTALGNTQVGMNAPRGLAYDDDNNILYVSQTTGNRVTGYDVSSITDGEAAISVLGQTTYTVISAGTTQAGMSGPNGVMIDEANDLLYVLQSTNNRVTLYDVASITDGENAVDLLGQYDDDIPAPVPVYTKLSANNGPNRFGMSSPNNGIILDETNHRLFVTDTGNNRILVYNLDSSNNLIDRLPDNVLGQTNFYSNANATTQTGLNSPNGIAYDSTNQRLFVTQTTANRVTVYDVTTITDGEAATNVLGQANFTATVLGNTQAGMNNPIDAVYDGISKLFVAQGTGNRVTVYDVTAITDGENAINVLGQAGFTTITAATTQAGMNVPQGVAYDNANKRLFVSQATGNRVTVYDVTAITDGENAINVLGQANFTATALGNTQAGMNSPRGITYDDVHNRLWVTQATGNRVTMYDTTSITDGENAITVYGQPDFTTITAGITQFGVSAPNGVEVDPANHRVYVLQSGTNRVSVFDTRTSIGNGKPANNVLGQSSFTVITAATTQAGMNAPYDAVYDAANQRLFVAQTTGNRVTTYDVASITDGENAVNVLGQTDFTSTAVGNTQVGMNAPRGLAYDPATRYLYVAQTTGNRVTVYDVNAITDGENAINVLGQAGFTTITIAATQAGLGTPQGLAIDNDNNRLYVAQAGASRISVFDIATLSDGENAIDLLGQYDDNLITPGPIYTKSTINNVASPLGLNGPSSVALDPENHNLFVTDTANNRVLVFELNPDNTIGDYIPDMVLGQSNFYTNAPLTTQSGLSNPQDVVYDEGGERLFVSDGNNARVLIYDTTALATGMNASYVLGQTFFTTSTSSISQYGFVSPRGLYYDSTTGRLYVTDVSTHRVIVFDVGTSGGGGGSGGSSGGGSNEDFYFIGF